MLRTLAISGYRSLRDVRIELGPLNIVTGPNGSGKSSLYRALRLLADVAQGRIIQSLAREGGLSSTLWAGPESIGSPGNPGQAVVRKSPVSLKLGYSGQDYGYAIDLGLPKPSSSLFAHDPEIKLESIWTGGVLSHANALTFRAGANVNVRDPAGVWRRAYQSLAPFDSMMTYAGDTDVAFERLLLRERMRNWRFYDSPRADVDAPARRPQVGTHTPVLASDGADLAAALQTIREIGPSAELDRRIEDAFPGSRVEIKKGGQFEITMRQQGLLRPLAAAELSDGTLRYLLLIAALLTPRPPELMVLNEPEASLYPDLLAPLARLIEQASSRSQIVVVTHSAALVQNLATVPGARPIRLAKQSGETIVAGDASPKWSWPSR
jgi:predicted ATPase